MVPRLGVKRGSIRFLQIFRACSLPKPSSISPARSSRASRSVSWAKASPMTVSMPSMSGALLWIHRQNAAKSRSAEASWTRLTRGTFAGPRTWGTVTWVGRPRPVCRGLAAHAAVAVSTHRTSRTTSSLYRSRKYAT
ncbi:hypothetical protein B7767_19275 [Streptomyces sp. 13-12-16]|nr:hypothetical protein B7767_19275 [Streptomyces sp. 13-12-16]